jgi:hypothetical protein
MKASDNNSLQEMHKIRMSRRTLWKKRFYPDHVHATWIPIFNAYCEECHETISYWPEFTLSYQREPLETIEQVVVRSLEGDSIRQSAAGIDYDPRTVSRWIRLVFDQAIDLLERVIRRILDLIGTEILPLTCNGVSEPTALLLAWFSGRPSRSPPRRASQFRFSSERHPPAARGSGI